VTQRVRGSIEIAVPVADAFGYLDDPERSVELLPDVVDVIDVESLPNGGHRVRFKALGRGGRVCNWVSETLERVPDRRVVVRATTERLSTVGTREFTESRNGTRVDVTVEYDVEMPLLATPLKPVTEFQMRKPMRRSLETLLARAKTRIEP
jgi:carbon monoxide dehydrogenase subunit G